MVWLMMRSFGSEPRHSRRASSPPWAAPPTRTSVLTTDFRLRAILTCRYELAKAKGRWRGEQPKPNPRQEAHLIAMLETGEHSTAELADLFGVGRSTVYRAEH